MKIRASLMSLVLKLVGGILLISGILDYIFSLIPSQWQDLKWQVSLFNGFVDQGIVPLVGICFIFIAWWVEDTDTTSQPSSGLRIAVLTISCILGLFYLLLIPLHLGNVNQISNGLMTQLDQQVSQQQAQLDGLVAQLEAVSQDPQRLEEQIQQRNQLIQSGGVIQGRQLSPEELQLLQNETQQLQEILNLSANPEQLTAKLQEFKNDREAELEAKEQEERQKTRGLILQQSLQTAIRSFILAIAYTVIGWFGFRGVMSGKSV